MKVRSTLVLAVAALTGCASGGGGDPGANDIVPTGAVQYSGTFREVQSSDGRVGMNVVLRVNGNVRIIYREATGRSNVSLTLGTSLNSPELLVWAVVPGRCGNGGVPVMPTAQFPPLEVTNAGRGDLTASNIPLEMPQRDYHVNVYRGGESLSNVIACANLRASAAE